MPSRTEFESAQAEGDADDYLPAASRAGLRALVVGHTLLTVGEKIGEKVAERRSGVKAVKKVGGAAGWRNNGKFRSSLALAVLIVVHRVLYRFFHRLRTNLSLPQAKEFRQRYPRAAKVFLSPLCPSLMASLSGVALGIAPEGDMRVTAAVYTLVKAAEYWYNRLEELGWFQGRRWVSTLLPSAARLDPPYTYTNDC